MMAIYSPKVKIFNNNSHQFDKTFVNAFNDADWEGYPNACRSYSRAYFYLGTNLIHWFSKKKTFVSHSSIESEYRALVKTTTEIRDICFLLGDLGIYQLNIHLRFIAIINQPYD